MEAERSTALNTKQRKSSRAGSKAMHAAIEKRMLRAPLIVKGIGPGRLATIKPSEFGRLDVDPSYQRGETQMINQIIRTVQSGGSIPDPVTLCERKHSRDGRLWIVDGYQRVCAFQQLKVPFTAMVHESESAEAEHQLFIALNTRKAVHANVIIKAWNGPSGELLRKANADFSHPLYQRINFQQGSNVSRLSASSLLRATLVALGVNISGSSQVLLGRADTELGNKLQRARAEHFLRLIGKACPKDTMPHMVLRSIAQVAREHWDDEVEMPSQKIIARIANKNWNGEILVEKYFGVLVEATRKLWR